MIYILIILSVLTILLLIRFVSLKKEMKKINEQLQSYNRKKTNKKIDMALLDKDIEILGAEINNLIDLHVKEMREKIRYEMERKQVIANISHDLRTPLTSILGYIQMAESHDITDDEQKEYLATAKNRAKRLEVLLHDFFELSVIESPDHYLKSERLHIKNVAMTVLMSFYDLLNEKDIEPIIKMPDKDVFIVSDESAVTRVIENLLSNAAAHSDGNIMMRLEEQESVVRLIVTNDAYSLSEKDVAH